MSGKFCKNCGTEIGANCKFCTKCGEKVSADKMVTNSISNNYNESRNNTANNSLIWQDFVDVLLNNYANFNGRVTRAYFWHFSLVYFIIYIVLAIISAGVLDILFSLATIIPSLAVTTRRLHDIGKSGWWQLLWLIPVIGWIIIIFLLAQKSKSTHIIYG